MSQVTNQPNQPDRSDSTASEQTSGGDTRSPWRAPSPRTASSSSTSPKHCSSAKRFEEVDAYAVAGIVRLPATEQPVVAQA